MNAIGKPLCPGVALGPIHVLPEYEQRPDGWSWKSR